MTSSAGGPSLTPPSAFVLSSQANSPHRPTWWSSQNRPTLEATSRFIRSAPSPPTSHVSCQALAGILIVMGAHTLWTTFVSLCRNCDGFDDKLRIFSLPLRTFKSPFYLDRGVTGTPLTSASATVAMGIIKLVMASLFSEVCTCMPACAHVHFPLKAIDMS